MLSIRHETKWNEARVSNGSAAFVDRPVIDRDRETAVPKEDSHLPGDRTALLAVDSFFLTSCKYHSCRIKAAWHPTLCSGHWLACRGRVCVRSHIGTPNLRIWDTPRSRTPDRNVATTCPWDAVLSALAATIGNVPSNPSGTPGRNYNPPRRTTRQSSPLSPEPPGSPPASRRRSDGIGDCAARVQSMNRVLWVNLFNLIST